MLFDKIRANIYKIATFGMLAALLSLSAYTGFLSYRYNNLKGEYDTLLGKHGFTESELGQCKAQFNVVNERLSGVERTYGEMTRQFIEFQNSLRNTERYAGSLAIRNQQTPSSCEEALDFVNRYIGAPR